MIEGSDAAGAGWRPMTVTDLQDVDAIARAVHPGFPERPEVFTERLALFPAGCLILERDGEAAGYLLSHPWHAGAPPPLDSLLGRLPPAATTYYLHDIALLPRGRGTGAAGAALPHLVRQARIVGADNLSLVAVNNSAPFWQRHGFVAADAPGLADKLASYGGDALYMLRRVAS
ncbi:GNAT superfamily N-acetyltransferase [Chelatococcus caeni]|uniref:GNAT superfamily N-acetyltransferase n=1 Tax=Chelatococcus caeni TaxID=1348468 RepID=A0A840C143_9HYPH|nr:GNAT family N-acetyltransferase [Chelatococcus caeni]MBB4019265.1 GNAT superfamily N-acetyltransferase [Chelatococcus caeni]